MIAEQIYRVTIRGRRFESRNVRELLARAVSEKRNTDRMRRAGTCGPADGHRVPRVMGTE